jgi:hypothetical protein
MGQVRGRDTILECRITAFPQATNHWEKSGRRIMSSMRHTIDAYDDGDNWLTLSLRINDIEAKDYGEYHCVASNALGSDRDSIQLFGNRSYIGPPMTYTMREMRQTCLVLEEWRMPHYVVILWA